MCPKIKFCRRKYKWNACFIRCNQNWDRAWLKLQSCVLWKYLNVCELSVCLKKSRLSSALFFAIVLRAIIVSLFLKKFFEWLDPRSSILEPRWLRVSRIETRQSTDVWTVLYFSSVDRSHGKLFLFSTVFFNTTFQMMGKACVL